MKTIKWVSLEKKLAGLEMILEGIFGDLDDMVAKNQYEQKLLDARETALMALKLGNNTEYGRSEIDRAIAQYAQSLPANIGF